MKKLMISAAVLSILVVSVGFADDFNPPGWRGGNLSVETEWTFENDPCDGYDIQQDYSNSVGGDNGETLSEYHTHIDLDDTWGWVPDPDGTGSKGAGIWTTGMAVHVANWIDNEPYKDMRIQVTAYSQNGGEISGEPDWMVVGGAGWTIPLSNWEVLDSGKNYDSESDINYAWTDIRIYPNPDYESVVMEDIPTDIIFDQIRVDTISVPEPATVCLLGLGGILLRKRNRS